MQTDHISCLQTKENTAEQSLAGHTTRWQASNNYQSCSCQDDFMYLTLKQYKLNIWLWEGKKTTLILR